MFTTLATQASDRYRREGLSEWLFARGKLRGDPVYRALAAHPAVRAARSVVDIGCGSGLSLALLIAAFSLAGLGAARPRLTGIELRPRVAAVARRALAGEAEILTTDARAQPLPATELVLLFDVVHMMSAPAQESLLDAAVACLQPGGHLLLREADAAAGWRFHAVGLGNRFNALLRHGSVRGFHFRTAAEWRAALAARGLEVEMRPTGEGTPFANVLFAARKPA